MGNTSARLLSLLSLLQTPREWAGGELAERLGVSPRTVRRDIDRLRDLGYPVQATMGPVGGYRLVAGTAMPPLLLDDEEAVAIAVGLRTAAGNAVEGIGEASLRAMAKLEQVLPSRLRRRVAALNAVTVPLPEWGDGPRVDPQTLAVLAATAAGRERLRFAYESVDGAASRRLVEPHRLVPAGRRWYLVAFDNDRDDWRIFRVDRVAEPRPVGQRFEPREPPGRDAAAFVLDRIYSLAPTYRAVATLHLPAERVRGRLGDSPEEIEPIDAHRCRLNGHADTLEWLASRLIMLGCEFEVHEPPELIEYLRELGARAARAAGAPGPAGPPVPPGGVSPS
ncbi:helix-turn-helix transcriptional regulator [Actinomadura rugatobispora]|uniref:Helix-turn-helix transcriptional regulator n=1 Tax=Actinomadura rugatobispora TaxID=1994 RepID=A0ABW1A7E1_9ACTN|nr:YafY family protein [Actinomadura rugatobispora]